MCSIGCADALQNFGDARRPVVCGSLQASAQMCGLNEDVAQTREFAMRYLTELESLTK